MSTLSATQDKILFRCWLALLVLAPIPWGSTRPWSAALLTAASLILLAMWLLRHGQTITAVTVRNYAPLIGGLTGVAAWTAIQAWTGISTDSHTSLFIALQSMGLAATAALTALLVRSRERLRSLMMMLVICGVANSFYAIARVFGADPLDPLGLAAIKYHVGDATGTYVNRNHFAGYMEMTLSLGLGLLIADMKADAGSWREFTRNMIDALLGEKGRLRIFLVMTVVGLVMSHSRMGNTAFFTAMTVTGLFYVLLTRKLTKGMMLLFGSLLAIDALIVSQWFGLERLAERMSGTVLTEEHRFQVTPNLIAMFHDNLPWGTGGGTFFVNFPQWGGPGNPWFLNYAHNDYLQFGIEFGIPGLILFSVIVGYALFNALLAMRDRKSRMMQGLAFGAFMGVTALMLHSVTDFNLQVPANAQLFVILLTLCVMARKMESNQRPKRIQRP